MNKVAVVYWSGTGHTQTMAEAVAKGSEGTLICQDKPDDDARAECVALGRALK